jgi:hypothetical protein
MTASIRLHHLKAGPASARCIRHWHIAHHVLMSAAWETQIAGHEVGAAPGNLDLTDFSHARARLLFEFEF